MRIKGVNLIEDLFLKYYRPEAYRRIQSFIAESRQERENYLRKECDYLQGCISSSIDKYTLTSRVKGFYSIYEKMLRSNKRLEEIHDLFGIRIVCDDIADCYRVLSKVHKAWEPLESRFKDYIVNPKLNGYQSLHTTVLGDNKRPIEIQIRSKGMHMHACWGSAAHDHYKPRNSAIMSMSEFRGKDIFFLSRKSSGTSPLHPAKRYPSSGRASSSIGIPVKYLPLHSNSSVPGSSPSRKRVLIRTLPPPPTAATVTEAVPLGSS